MFDRFGVSTLATDIGPVSQNQFQGRTRSASLELQVFQPLSQFSSQPQIRMIRRCEGQS